MVKSLADGTVCDGRNPEPLQWLSDTGFLDNPAGDQLAFPSGIGCNNNCIYIFAAHLRLYGLILFPCFWNHLYLQFFWQHGQRFHFPCFPLFAIAFRIGKFYEMSECPRYDIISALQKAVPAVGASEYPGNIPAYAWFFCDY